MGSLLLRCVPDHIFRTTLIHVNAILPLPFDGRRTKNVYSEAEGVHHIVHMLFPASKSSPTAQGDTHMSLLCTSVLN